jgi:hypothetical protein
MKKLLFLTLVLTVITTAIQAQGQASSDPATMLQQMKVKIVPQMVEKTGLTEAQANKVVEINFELRQSMLAHKDLSEADRAKKVAEFKAAREKRYSEIPLTPEQIKSVLSFYESMGRNAPPKTGN